MSPESFPQLIFSKYNPSVDRDDLLSSPLGGELAIGECLNEHSLHGEPESDYSSTHVSSEKGHITSSDFVFTVRPPADASNTSPSTLHLVLIPS